MKIYIASAFSKNNSGGNKAGVCLLREQLNDNQKKKIALELGYAETAYISAPNQDGANFKLEYFTPAEEVPLCGHATIAAFTVMRELKLLRKDNNNIQTKSGILSIRLESNMIYMEQNKPQFFEKIDSSIFENCFDNEVVSRDFPIQIVSTGLRDIMLPIVSLDKLNSMKPNFEEIKRISKEYDTIGIHAFIIQDNRIIVRNFAPLYDVPEESATGTANCALACYLYENDILKKSEYTFEQGYSLNEPSEIIVKLEIESNSIEKVIVGGSGYIVGEKEINLN